MMQNRRPAFLFFYEFHTNTAVYWVYLTIINSCKNWNHWYSWRWCRRVMEMNQQIYVVAMCLFGCGCLFMRYSQHYWNVIDFCRRCDNTPLLLSYQVFLLFFSYPDRTYKLFGPQTSVRYLNTPMDATKHGRVSCPKPRGIFRSSIILRVWLLTNVFPIVPQLLELFVSDSPDTCPLLQFHRPFFLFRCFIEPQ